jgi:tetratricopeptide (TPR) repeat protein
VKRFLAGLLLLCLFVAAVYGYNLSLRERNYARFIDQGDAALARDDTSEALEAFSYAIGQKPVSMLGYLKRGEAYRRRNELEPALRDLRQASELDPLAPRPLELIGDVNYAMGRAERQDMNVAMGRFERAAERYQACVRLDDRSPRVLYKLALAHHAAGETAPAVQALRKAIALDDRAPEAHYLLGVCLRDLNRAADALAAFERSRALAPAMVNARESLGDLFGQLGRTRDRVAQLEALHALDPNPMRAVALGLAYHDAGDSNRAVLILSDAAEGYPEYSYTYVAVGRVWLDVAEARRDRVFLSKALGALQRVIDRERSSEALTLFGRALLLANDDAQAERVLTEAAAKMPVDADAFYYLARAAERRGRPEVARRALLDFDALVGVDPASADISLLVRLADAQAHAGDLTAARGTLARALDRAPTFGPALMLQRRLANR